MGASALARTRVRGQKGYQFRHIGTGDASEVVNMNGPPPLVEEAEWWDTGQVGAAYVHTYYPAFIDITQSSLFITPIQGKPICIHLVRHVKALEVTDFNNFLTEQEQGIRRLPVIRRPINGVRIASVTATARDAWGGKGIFIAHELSTNGRIFRNRPFTEIIIGREIRNAVEDNTLVAFYI